jgi:phosphonate transport system ATP-binding protein
LLLFIQKPSIILADEPTTSLDLKISKEIIEKICSFKDSLLIINIHKLDLIPDDVKRIIGIKNGLIIFDGSKKDLSKKIEEIYE